MKIELIFARTEYDTQLAWTGVRKVVIDVPFEQKDGWNVVGAIWPPEGERDAE